MFLPGIFFVIPSHQTPPSSVCATLVKTVSLKMDFMAIGLLLSDVPGATPKKPFSGLMALCWQDKLKYLAQVIIDESPMFWLPSVHSNQILTKQCHRLRKSRHTLSKPAVTWLSWSFHKLMGRQHRCIDDCPHSHLAVSIPWSTCAQLTNPKFGFEELKKCWTMGIFLWKTNVRSFSLLIYMKNILPLFLQLRILFLKQSTFSPKGNFHRIQSQRKWFHY